MCAANPSDGAEPQSAEPQSQPGATARDMYEREEQHPSRSAAGDGRPETSLQRLDRNLEEMTGELRVVVTGVQVLFAFLLIVPFNTGFTGIGPFERGVYFATLLCSALAALCTLAPAAYHRLLFRADDKRHLVFLANRVSIAGLAFLALAMCGSLLLVTTKLFGAAAGAITAGAMAVPFAGLWFAAPLLRRAAREHEAPADGVASTRALQARDPLQHAKAVRYDSRVAAQEHLQVEARRTDDRVVLALTGELDLASSAILERALEDAEVVAAPLLVLDLDELKFVDSTGLRVILLAREGSRARGQEFAITPGSPQVQRLLSITSVAEHMRVIASPDDSLV
jgi:anti-anti-sigma factor